MLELTDSVEQYLIFKYAVDKNLSLVLLQDVEHVLYVDQQGDFHGLVTLEKEHNEEFKQVVHEALVRDCLMLQAAQEILNDITLVPALGASSDDLDDVSDQARSHTAIDAILSAIPNRAIWLEAILHLLVEMFLAEIVLARAVVVCVELQEGLHSLLLQTALGL